jgi:hypothetical protein
MGLIHDWYLKNSFNGNMFIEEGPWSNGTALILNKIRGLCRNHKASGIRNSSAELGGQLAYLTWTKLSTMVIHLMNSMHHLRHPWTSMVVLRNLKNHIKTLQAKQHKFCRTHMRTVFTHGHTSTKRREGISAVIKGHCYMHETLRNAALVELNQIIDCILWGSLQGNWRAGIPEMRQWMGEHV